MALAILNSSAECISGPLREWLADDQAGRPADAGNMLADLRLRSATGSRENPSVPAPTRNPERETPRPWM